MEVFKELNHVQTRLLIWGDPFSKMTREVIVCITGNPGIIDFYFEFCSELHRNTGLPVCLIGQGGHDVIPEGETYSLKTQGYLFDLQGQVNHKLDLLNNHIDVQCKLHLIGHSIGAWMILESIQKDPTVMSRIASVNLLFPTLQEMAITKNGPFVNTLRKFHSLVMFLITLFNMLPAFFIAFIAKVYLMVKNLPMHFTNRLMKYANRTILDRVLFLAYDEMNTVRTLNREIIIKIKHVTNVIYSQNDGWVPLKYMDDLREFLPLQQMTEVPYSHVFVLKSSEEVAELVSKYIKIKQKTD